MPISLADLTALEERINEDIKRSQAELEAVRLLKHRIRADGPQSTVGQLTFDSPELSSVAHIYRSFSEAVREGVAALHETEFTVADVENVLKARNIRLPENNPRARIAMVLQDMVEFKKTITKTFSGSGNTPNRYRLVRSEKTEGASASTQAPSHYN